jgi:hypothetical protein
MKQKWEYKIVVPGGFFSIKVDGVKYNDIGEWLNEMGDQGWELVHAPGYNTSDYIFKRLKD